ncbi:hypothetical protein GCM10027256_36150 [Novispirillum itersonii subsp. nipponicum]
MPGAGKEVGGGGANHPGTEDENVHGQQPHRETAGGVTGAGLPPVNRHGKVSCLSAWLMLFIESDRAEGKGADASARRVRDR